MSEFSPGEELLVGEGFIGRRSEHRRDILSCVGCIWSRRRQESDNSPFALAAEIQACRGIPLGIVSRHLKQLGEIDAISTTIGNRKGYGVQCLKYAPSESFHGQLLESVLKPVPNCKTPLLELAESKPSHSQVQDTVGEPILRTPTQTVPDLVEALRKVRLERGILQKNAAAAVGLEYPTFSSQEANGKMTFKTFVQYAGVLGLEVVLRPIDSEAPQPDTEEL